jgi:hypothetical protein
VLARHAGSVQTVSGAAAAQQVLRGTVAGNLYLLAALTPAARGLEEAGLRWAAVKGLDHLARIYPGLEWRQMCDVDLLAHPDDVGAAQRVLEGVGFVPFVGTPAVQPGRCSTKAAASVDLHRCLVRRGGFVEDVDWLLEDTSVVDLEGCPVRLMAPARALAAHTLLLAKDGFFAEMVLAERVVELGLLAEAAGPDGEAEAWARLERWGAGRVAVRGRDLLAWLRGGERPDWADRGFGEPGAGVGAPPSMARRLLRGASLQGSPRVAARWMAAQVRSFLLQRLSGRRLGRWEEAA